ncbi:hypothetical protein ACFL4G_01745 [Thermodesulfobacteriota bacterium]
MVRKPAKKSPPSTRNATKLQEVFSRAFLLFFSYVVTENTFFRF